MAVAVTTQLAGSSVQSDIITEWLVDFAVDGDVTSGAVAHGMLFTPNILGVFPVRAPTCAEPIYCTVVVTATTFTATHTVAGGAVGNNASYRVILGRFPSVL